MGVRRFLFGGDDGAYLLALDERRSEPMADVPRQAPPEATISPIPYRSWVRRAWPVIRTHRWIWLLALAGSFVALSGQVQIPRTPHNDSVLPAQEAAERAAPALRLVAEHKESS